MPQFDLSDVKLYPNPTSNIIHIECNSSKVENIIVKDLTGKILLYSLSALET